MGQEGAVMNGANAAVDGKNGEEIFNAAKQGAAAGAITGVLLSPLIGKGLNSPLARAEAKGMKGDKPNVLGASSNPFRGDANETKIVMVVKKPAIEVADPPKIQIKLNPTEPPAADPPKIQIKLNLTEPPAADPAIQLGNSIGFDSKINSGLPRIKYQTSINDALVADLSDDCVTKSFEMIGKLTGKDIRPETLRAILTADGGDISKYFLPVKTANGITYRMTDEGLTKIYADLGFKPNYMMEKTDALEALKTGVPAMVNKNGHMVVVKFHDGVLKEMDPLRGYWVIANTDNYRNDYLYTLLP
jgi:hypothetical protein